MSLPLLYAPPDSDQAWKSWSFNHAAIHYTLIGAVGTQKNNHTLAQYLLDPMDLNDLGMWLYQHQSMHNQMNAALGTQGYDLLSYDITDPEQLQTWLNLNGDEHVRFSQILGV